MEPFGMIEYLGWESVLGYSYRVTECGTFSRVVEAVLDKFV